MSQKIFKNILYCSVFQNMTLVHKKEGTYSVLIKIDEIFF